MMSERLFEFDTEAELLEAFGSFDENDSGTVKVEEMRKWLGERIVRMALQVVFGPAPGSSNVETLKLKLKLKFNLLTSSLLLLIMDTRMYCARYSQGRLPAFQKALKHLPSGVRYQGLWIVKNVGSQS